jgi:mono/diheme cytochrome c family protein
MRKNNQQGIQKPIATKFRKVLIHSSYIILLCSPVLLRAQTWEVPANKNAEVSPIKFDAATQKEGAALLQKHCISCHGEPGKNNGAALTPLPGDFASEKFSKQTDGALFFKITNGRGLMPKFGSVTKEDERWKIISYIRTFHKGYVQPEPKTGSAGSKKSLEIKVSKLNANTLEALAFSTAENRSVPEANVELSLQVKRYFGKLQLGEAVATNANGKAVFTIDPSLPADTSGNLTVIVSPTDKELYGDAESVNTFEMGIKNSAPALNAKRAIWNVVQKAPLWILFTYIIGVLGVWSVIGYIVLQLVRLNKKN